MPPLNDVVVKLLLRSPNGVDLRVTLIQLHYDGDTDRYYFMQSLKQLIKYTREFRE